MSIQGMATQQTEPIKPCVVEKPCTTEATPASKGASATKGTSVRKRTPASKPTSATPPARGKGRVSEILIDASIPDDPALEKMLEPFSAKVRALDVVIGKLETELKKGPVGGGNLGNFATDGMRVLSSAKLGRPVLLAVTNSGGLRKNTIAPGDLRAADIFELLPFENALTEVDLTGEQLLRLLNVVVSSGDALSGARITYRMNANKRPEMIGARLLDSQGREMEIDPNATYSIVTIDYLLKLGGGRYSVLLEGKNVRPLGVTIRDAIMDYVKAESAAGRPIKATLDERFVLIGPNAPKPGSQQR
ncbi:MAG: 5'-nucleotidase C-terminal domain-containing protein [Pyrinomonadaceae bacterium]|nr:5'-nucleotidase C-terminal domain-containing protein [Pyrinomonadaceae bacterium]